MKIYTRTGDAGTTSLVGGIRISKASARLEAYGTTDELNSHLGYLLTFPDLDEDARLTLTRVQNRLFNLGAYLATDPESNPNAAPQGLDRATVGRLEQEIDRMTARLPELRAFILPGGTAAAAQANICRTVCRRAERRVVALETVDDEAIQFLNRLSDYLFTLGRALNHSASCPESIWQP